MIDAVVLEKLEPVDQLEEIIKQLFEYTETHPQIISFIFYTKHTDFLPSEPLMFDAEPFNRIKAMIFDVVDTNNNVVSTSFIMGGMIRMIQLRLDGFLADPLVDSLDVFMNNLYSGLKSK